VQDDDLVNRWALRRKRVQEEAEALERAARDTAAADEEAEIANELAEQTLTEEELLAKWELPNPDEVVSGDDLTGFFTEGVPEFLRRRALRALWVSNPILANLDGLNDYDTDFTIVEPIISSSYTAGVGYAKQAIEQVFADMPDSETRSVRPPEVIRTLAGAEPAHPEPDESGQAQIEDSLIENDALQNASREQALHTQREAARDHLFEDSEETALPVYRYPARMRFDSSPSGDKKT
jgi:hypothetical protein